MPEKSRQQFSQFVNSCPNLESVLEFLQGSNICQIIFICHISTHLLYKRLYLLSKEIPIFS